MGEELGILLIYFHLITSFEVVSILQWKQVIQHLLRCYLQMLPCELFRSNSLEVANQLNGKHMKKIVAVLKELSIKQEKLFLKNMTNNQYLETTLILTSSVCLGVIQYDILNVQWIIFESNIWTTAVLSMYPQNI